MIFVPAFCDWGSAKTADIQVAIKLKLDYCKGINTGVGKAQRETCRFTTNSLANLARTRSR